MNFVERSITGNPDRLEICHSGEGGDPVFKGIMDSRLRGNDNCSRVPKLVWPKSLIALTQKCFGKAVFLTAFLFLNGLSLNVSAQNNASETMCTDWRGHYHGQSTKEAIKYTKSKLKRLGKTLSLVCPATFEITSEYRKNCEVEMSQCVDEMNLKWRLHGLNLEHSAIVLSDEMTCIDTFVSGCEQSDCITYLRSEIPLNWK